MGCLSAPEREKMGDILALPSLRQKLHNLRQYEGNWSFLDQHTGAIRDAWLSMAHVSYEHQGW